MKRHTLLAMTLAVGIATVSSVTAASIGMSFLGRNAATRIEPTESAGVVAQTHWNNINSESPFSGTTPPLVDNSGAFTAVQLVYQCNDSWSSGGPVVTPDDRLMKGIIKANPDPDTAPINNTDRMTFVVTNLTAGTYDVIVYVMENDVTATAIAEMDLTVGSTTYFISQQANFDGVFVPASSTTPGNYVEANYGRFNGVAPVNGTITITAKKNIVNPQLNDGIGVAGIQLIQTSGSFPANATNPGISNPALPADAAAAVGGSAAFSVVPDGFWNVQWQKNGANIPGATGTSYTAASLTLADNGAKYKAIVSNNLGQVESREATLTVAAPVYSPGFLTIKFYENITGTAVQNLLDAPAFQNKAPDSTTFIPAFDTPNGHGDNYGAEVTGWVVPEVTANYYFFIRSDDASALYLNETGEAIPDPRTGLTPIAEETGCCDAFHPPGDPETSIAINLQAGKKYGVCALLKEGGGGDYLQVAWSSDPNVDPTKLQPMPGKYLATEALALGRTITIDSQPASQSRLEAQAATFTAGFTVAPDANAFGIQWQKNGADIPGANSRSYVTPPLTLADSGAKFKAIIKIPGNISATTDEATLTVLPDTVPPVVTAAGSALRQGGVTLGVEFDENVEAASASLASNYTLSKGTVGTATYQKFAHAGGAENFVLGSAGPFYANAVTLTTTGLNPGDTVTLTVKNVKDLKGNAITSVTKDITITTNMNWAQIGGNEYVAAGEPADMWPVAVVPVGTGDFDLICGGSANWNAYDEAAYVYEEVTGDFDKVVRMEYQDPTSQWARMGLHVRIRTDEGTSRADAEGGTKPMSQNLSIRASNPLQWSGSPANNAWEWVYRSTEGGNYGNSGGGGAPAYPNAWCRIQRVGDVFTGYVSTDGSNWTVSGTYSAFDPPLPPKVLVGPYYAPEYGNNGTKDGVQHSAVAKFRQYGNFGATPAEPKLDSITVNAQGQIVIVYSGGTLQSSTGVPSTTWTDVSTPSGQPITPPASGNAFYRVKGN